MMRVLSSRFALLLACLVSPAQAQQFTLSPGEAAVLDQQTIRANQTVERDGADWSLRFDGPAADLPPWMSISALCLLDDGSFLFASDTPVTLEGTTYLPRDVIRRSGASYALHSDGAALGLPESARVDAVALIDGERLALSFDEATNLDGKLFLPADVAIEDGVGGFASSFDASASGLGADVNVVGYDRDDAGSHLLVFDAPVDVGGLVFLPGEIARFDGNAWSTFFSDPQFPYAMLASALSLPGSPGRVEGLRVRKGPGTSLDLDWQPSCSSETSDYAAFEGALEDFDSHAPLQCSTGGAAALNVQPAPGRRYYLVVPVNGSFEGSYGSDSNGAQRAPAAAPCREMRRVRACP